MRAGRRKEQQFRNRERILAAAQEEFAQVGYREAKINSIASRAELTRGAIYSNFPSKRALGLTVAASALRVNRPPLSGAVSREDVVVSVAQARLARLPTGRHGDASRVEQLRSDLYAEIRQDPDLRDACAALLQLGAIIFARALEGLDTDDPIDRAVRVASAVLTVLHSADSLSAAAPGFIVPFTVVATCKALASTDFDDRWSPPHESIVPATQTIDRAWEPMSAVTDLVTDAPVQWESDGIVAILGLRQAAGIEQALRAAPHGHRLFVVLVSDEPAERIPLARFVLCEAIDALRDSVPPTALARLSLVLDPEAAIARSAGLRATTDDTHVAIEIKNGRMTRFSEGPAACHAIAIRQGATNPQHASAN